MIALAVLPDPACKFPHSSHHLHRSTFCGGSSLYRRTCTSSGAPWKSLRQRSNACLLASRGLNLLHGQKCLFAEQISIAVCSYYYNYNVHVSFKHSAGTWYVRWFFVHFLSSAVNYDGSRSTKMFIQCILWLFAILTKIPTIILNKGHVLHGRTCFEYPQ